VPAQWRRPTGSRSHGPELGPDSGGRPKGGAATTLKQQKQRETELASQAETAYRRLMADWQQSVKGAGATH
jgi:hypothetical protein